MSPQLDLTSLELRVIAHGIDPATGKMDLSRYVPAEPKLTTGRKTMADRQDYVIEVYGRPVTTWLTCHSDEETCKSAPTTTDPELAVRFSDLGEARQQCKEAAKKYLTQAFRVGTLPRLKEGVTDADLIRESAARMRATKMSVQLTPSVSFQVGGEIVRLDQLESHRFYLKAVELITQHGVTLDDAVLHLAESVFESKMFP